MFLWPRHQVCHPMSPSPSCMLASGITVRHSSVKLATRPGVAGAVSLGHLLFCRCTGLVPLSLSLPLWRNGRIARLSTTVPRFLPYSTGCRKLRVGFCPSEKHGRQRATSLVSIAPTNPNLSQAVCPIPSDPSFGRLPQLCQLYRPLNMSRNPVNTASGGGNRSHYTVKDEGR